MNKEAIRVVDQAGLRGQIDDPTFTPQRNGEVKIRFSGHQISVPGAMLVAQKDGSYWLPLSFAALAEAGEQTNQPDGEPLVLPVIEEELQVTKRQVEQGVRVTKLVHEQPEQVELPLIKEEVEVQRIPINRPVTQPVTTRQEGDVWVIPVLEEVLVVQKQWILKEEIHIITKRSERRQVVEETVRREEVLVEPIQNKES